jgi:hypothetical protein
MDLQENKEIIREDDGIKYLTVSVFFAILSFFLILNTISVTNSSKSENLQKALKDEFSNKDLKEEFRLFDKRQYDQKKGTFKLSFRDLLISFLETQEKTVDAEFSETPKHYVIKVSEISFFGPNSIERRPNADKFLKALDTYISINKTSPDISAQLIIPYTDKQNIIDKRLLSLDRVFKNKESLSIRLSSSKTQDALLTKHIYILFDKNEF